MANTLGLLHFLLRKRFYKKLGRYPSRDKVKKFVDGLICLVGILGPILTIPQLTKIWIEKNASGVSLISWSAYLIFAVVWLVYGVVHREKTIVSMYTIWIFIDALIVAGIVLYG